jgi:hypothetical protein
MYGRDETPRKVFFGKVDSNCREEKLNRAVGLRSMPQLHKLSASPSMPMIGELASQLFLTRSFRKYSLYS